MSRALIAAIVILAVSPRTAAQMAITITDLGQPVASRPLNAPGGGAPVEYFVDELQHVSGTLKGRPPQGVFMHAYVLLRAAGDPTWRVQADARLEGSRWGCDVRIGKHGDVGRRFDLRVVATRTALALGELPSGMLDYATLASSPVLRVVRRGVKPEVWVPTINGTLVTRDEKEVLNVGYQAHVGIGTRDLPEGAVALLAIHPVLPWTDLRWVMVDTVSAPHGVITGHFGVRGMHAFHQFRVIPFITRKLPPVGVPIPPDEWRQYEREFLAEAPPITVWRWEGETAITHVDGVRVRPKVTIAAEPQAQVDGTIREPLRAGERLWLLCVPKGGDPWVAGWTTVWHGGGRWTVHSATLDRPASPHLFDLIAVVSSDDPRKVGGADLRAWLQDAREPSANSVRTRVVSISAGLPRRRS